MKKLLSILFLFMLISNGIVYAQESNQLHFVAKKKGFRLYKGDNLVSKTIYIEYSDFSEGLCAVTDDGWNWGFINGQGQVVVPIKYEEVSDFSDGVSLVSIGGYSSFINNHGKVIGDIKYAHIDYLENGIGIGMIMNPDTAKYGRFVYVFNLVGKTGKPISSDFYTAISQINDSLFQAVIYNSEYHVFLDGNKKLIGNIPYYSSNTANMNNAEVTTGPEFPSGDKGRLNFLRSNIIYPRKAIESGRQGTVYTTFMVKKDGSILYPNILRGVCPSIDTECIRIIRILPKWKAGKKAGNPVQDTYNMPIRFVIAG